MGAREDVLTRIRGALADVPENEELDVPRDYHRTRVHPEGTVERFCERVADYRATVTRVPAGGVGAAVAAALADVGAALVAIPRASQPSGRSRPPTCSSCATPRRRRSR